MNTVDPGSAMPEGDAVYIYNMIAAEYGLRSRLGYREWCTGLTGALDNAVPNLLPFTGSAKNGAQNKLFAITSTGIWDVTTSSASPTQLITFDDQSEEAGRGVAHACATMAGRFLLYCDEANGLYIWSETASAWSKPTLGITALWASSTSYVAGDQVVNGAQCYECDTPGISGQTGPTGTGTGLADGDAAWHSIDAPNPIATSIGPSVADQRLGYAADPSTFVFVTVWKNRVWLLERDTSRAYYLDINAIYGPATSFEFGSKLRSGGPLVGLYNWSYDRGNGLDTLLVGISGAGDVVIYQGTDPTSAGDFGLRGCWSVGSVPSGRRIATDYGGDLLVLSSAGVVPLSRLVTGAATEEQDLYASKKVANLLNQLVSSRRTLHGWSLHIHPTDNALVVTVPSSTGGATEQLVMALAKRSWSRYRDLPIYSAAVWEGDFWFGTSDGRVCRNIDYVDAVTLAAPTVSTPVKWSVLGAYRNLGNMRQKRVQMLRPTLLSGAATPVLEAKALYDFDLIEPAEPSGTPAGGWDTDVWDTATWGGEYTAAAPVFGAAGMGRAVAIAVRGSASSRTVLVGVDVLFEQGGVL